ncbi:hypothetical protein FAES_0159 [Fibrella aestuarina BUZ 2]|uniref:Adhesin domain-containing protein n=1 Tax=Fibrella aestuarina BUZ 2 TaxID=1166018 RepID=I0K220_9BACT|nr:hypothetical protein [Fibrella aestuarina]CCG98173.1 hypothetical protein FAES_0159 [Fibrella aestuarina BUZ 2]
MTNLLTIIFLWLLSAAVPVVAQNDVKEQLTVPLTDPSKPGFLDVGLVNGSIHVVGYGGKEVVIDATSGSKQRAGRSRSDDNDRLNENLNLNLNMNGSRRDDSRQSAGMRRISSGNPFDLSAEEKNNRVKVGSGSVNSVINLTIKVPQRFSLKVHTVNNGDIMVDNVTGELEINNVNGAITLTNIAGSAVANTINGDMKATFRQVESNTPMAFSTLNGNVDVTFPASVKATIKLKSDRGEIFTDFDIDVEKGGSKVTRSSQSGMYRVAIDDWVYGKINSGGPEVMMKNMNGNIYVRKAK